MEQTVSVIVPIYNCADYLPKCIESILEQTYPHIQLILVDDGSTDGSGEICDAYTAKGPRIQVIHQENQGVSAARNAGLELVSGAYFMFIDGDDTITPHTIETALAGFFDDSISVCVFGVSKLQEGLRPQTLPMEVGVYNRDEVLRGILTDYAGFGAGFPVNKLWKTSVFGSTSCIPRFDEALFYFEDLEWVVRMMLQIRQANLLPQHCYQYRIHSASTTHKPGAQERRELGYHRSVETVISDLAPLPELQTWFSEKYHPELVNGVLHAWKMNWPDLRQELLMKLVQHKDRVLSSSSIPFKIKFRCTVLLMLHRLRFL